MQSVRKSAAEMGEHQNGVRPECAYKRIQARNKEERDYFLQHGICTRCRKAKAEEGRTMCPDCLEQMRQYNRQRKSR